jgi:polar amino acid transport system substrate-binding protein
MKRLFLFLILAVTVVLAAEGAAAKDAASKPPLRWAADSESGAPFVFFNPDRLEEMMGFEYDIATALASKLGREPVFVQNAWDGLIPGLNRDQYDIVINGLEITEDRKREILFSEPYFITFAQLVVRREEEKIKELADCDGHAVGTLKFSVAERILRGLPGVDVRTYEAETNSFADLRQGRIDAVLVDAPIAQYYATPDPRMKMTGKPAGELVYGIGMRKSDSRLKADIDRALAELIREGKMREIYDRWNLWNEKMGELWNDQSPSKTGPVKFDEYMGRRTTERTWGDRLELYVSVLPVLARGALTTLEISLLAMALAVVLGLILALMRLYGPGVLSGLSVCYIELIRGTPLLIQLFFIYYALPNLGIKFSPWVAAILGLGMNYAASEAENYRAGIQGVPKAQSEAAHALGMTTWQSIRHVILPQAIRIVIPPITNDFIALLKDSSLVSVITMVELTKIYGQLASTYYDYVGIGLLVALFYLLLGLPFVRLARWLERRLQAAVPSAATGKKNFGSAAAAGVES